MTALKFLILLSLVCAIRADEKCLYVPCTCTFPDSKLAVQCTNSSTSGFPSRNSLFELKPMQVLAYINYNFKEIPDRAFENLDVYFLVLSKNGLTKIGKNTFQGIKQLTNLYIQSESNLQEIESGAFEPLSGLVTSFSILYSMADTKLTAFSSEIQKLLAIEKISFDSSSLTQVPADIFKGLGKLNTVSLGYNQIKKIDAGAFNTNQKLTTLRINDNQLASLEEIFKAVKPPGGTQINDIYAGNNSITTLATQTGLETLSSLKLQDNQITKLDSQSLPGCDAIQYLDLTNNKLTLVDDARLAKMKRLQGLTLSKNYLSQVPVISTLNYLTLLDLSNQNGLLKKIPDYAFEKVQSSYFYLTINLIGNDIESFGDKAFCSRYFTTSMISSLSLSYKSMRNLNRCVLKQLNLKPVTLASEVFISDSTDPNTNLAELCNCDLLLFADYNNLKIKGVCEATFKTLTCDKTNYQDPCKNQTQYECVAIYSSTTTSTTPKTTTSSGIKLSPSYFYFLLLVLYSVLI